MDSAYMTQSKKTLLSSKIINTSNVIVSTKRLHLTYIFIFCLQAILKTIFFIHKYYINNGSILPTWAKDPKGSVVDSLQNLDTRPSFFSL